MSASEPVYVKVTEPAHRPSTLHPDTQVAPVGHVTLQSLQAPPLLPHALVTLPSWHVLSPQQPPWQGDFALQLVEHAPPLHALPSGQSVSIAQPQRPSTHAVPFVPIEQSRQAPPRPHAFCMLPVTQIPPLQQPPAHLESPAQLAPHSPVFGSQAVPGGQLVAVQGAAASEASRAPSSAASGGAFAPSEPASAHEPAHSTPSASSEQADGDAARTTPSAATRTPTRVANFDATGESLRGIGGSREDRVT